MNTNFTLSENHNPNYLAWICKITETQPIPKADRLVKITINGYDIVVSKETQPGDIVVYFPVETTLFDKFLSTNNLYESAIYYQNSNAEFVSDLLEKSQALHETDPEQSLALYNQAKASCGFFNKHGRVRILKLRGEYSMGFVIPVKSLVNTWPELEGTDWEQMVGTSFDTVCGDIICKKYIPVVNQATPSGDGQRNYRKSMKKLVRFDRIIPGTFEFHYDTKQLGEHFTEIKPSDEVTISVKVHGTSTIMSNIPVNRKLSTWEKIKKFFGFKVQETEYGNVYSSRRVIKNQYINDKVTDGFYSTDVWGEVNKVFSPLLEPNMTLYGEIVGYVPGSSKMIQAKHDYGCRLGEWKFMPYRVTCTNPDGSKNEWNLTNVDNWMTTMMDIYPELRDKVLPLNIVYDGVMADLYPEIPVDENWHKNVLEAMKNDKDRFLMEKDEPMCKNKVPREGVVIRIKNDKFARAWKLKSKRHYGFEAEQHDSGEADMEETA